MNFGIYTSGNATRIRSLLSNIENSSWTVFPVFPKILNGIKAIVYDGKNTEVCSELEKHIPNTVLIDYTDIPKELKNKYLSDEILKISHEEKIDYWIVNGGRILEGKLLTEYENRMINFHPGLLPAYAGPLAITRARQDGAVLSGITAHFIDAGMDTGPIILQGVAPIRGMTDDQILNSQMSAMLQVFVWLIDNRISVNGRIVTVKDAEFPAGFYYPNLDFFRGFSEPKDGEKIQ
jgi:phosphoribosylglycinamide formyltransferase-1